LGDYHINIISGGKKMKRVVFVALALVVCGSMLFAGGGKDSGKMKIGVSLPTLREERWTVDYRGFIDAAEKFGVEVIIHVADNSADRQRSQVETLITMGVKALIIAPQDAEAGKELVTIAHKAKIPVIAYDRPITDGKADLYICVGQFLIGKAMGEHILANVPSGNLVVLMGDATDDTVPEMEKGHDSVINARVNDGTYKIVYKQNIVDWDPGNALRAMEQALTANGNNIQGVIAHNDGMAGGAIQALAAQGLSGKVIVTGQDAEVDAIKRIIAGTQGMTISYNNLSMADAAIEAAVKLAKNRKDTGTTEKDSDGTPMISFPPGIIDKNNYKAMLIDTGLMSEDDLH
jgi:D-xylose transport system substrate-binding protein